MIDDKVSEALNLLQEECAEIIQAISKIRRFGPYSISPYKDDKSKTNLRLLMDEMGDYEVIKNYLIDKGFIDTQSLSKRQEYKLPKLKEYTTLFND